MAERLTTRGRIPSISDRERVDAELHQTTVTYDRLGQNYARYCLNGRDFAPPKIYVEASASCSAVQPTKPARNYTISDNKPDSAKGCKGNDDEDDGESDTNHRKSSYGLDLDALEYEEEKLDEHLRVRRLSTVNASPDQDNEKLVQSVLLHEVDALQLDQDNQENDENEPVENPPMANHKEFSTKKS